MVENKLHPSGKSLDLSKAYITVDHSVLLAELEYDGVRDLPNECFRSYFVRVSMGW